MSEYETEIKQIINDNYVISAVHQNVDVVNDS